MSGKDAIDIEVLRDADTFSLWKIEIEIYFRAKGLLSVVTGKSKVENCKTEDEKTKWMQFDRTARLAIEKTIGEEVKPMLRHCATAKAQFDKLNQVFGTQQLLQDFENFHFDDRRNVSDNIVHIRHIAFQVNKNHVGRVTDLMILRKVLGVLPEKFSSFKAAWFQRSEHEKTIDNLMSGLAEEEHKISETRRKTRANNHKDQAPLEKTVTSKKSTKEKTRKENVKGIQCNFCHRMNHEESKCHFKQKGDKKLCKYCKRNIHASFKCPFKEEREEQWKSAEENRRREAICKELQSLEENLTWSIVDEKYALGKEIISSRWVLKMAENRKYIARLVVSGHHQTKGTHSSDVQITSIRTLLAVGAVKDLQFKTFDVKSVCLNGDLKEEIFMKVPEEYNHPDKVCLLQKALYGLRQAPQLWFQRLTDFLKIEGLVQLKTDRCVFKNTKGMKTLYIAIHVDGGLILGEDVIEMDKLLMKMTEYLKITVSEDLKIYLGIEIAKEDKGFFLHQANYCSRVIKKHGLENSKPKETPIAGEDQSPSEENYFLYKEAVGSLLNVSRKTRPDLSYAVNCESRNKDNPSPVDIRNVKRSLRYLKGTTSLGIRYRQDKGRRDLKHLYVYFNAVYAGDKQEGKSTTGYVMLFAGGPISWSSNIQDVGAKPAEKAESRSVSLCCKEIQKTKEFIEEILDLKIHVKIYLDNLNTIDMIKPGLNEKEFTINQCPSGNQLAAIFTEPLMQKEFLRHRNFMLK